MGGAAGMVLLVNRHLEPVLESHAEDIPVFDADRSSVRPGWWRWVAVIVVVAMVVATPFIYALYRFLQ